MRAIFLFFCKFSALMIQSKRRKLWFRSMKCYIIHPAFMLLHTKLTRNITLNWFLQTTTASFVYPACWTENKHSNSNILYLNTIGFKAQSLWGRVQIDQIKFNQMQVCEERGKPEYPGKNLSEQRQTQPTYDTESGNRIPGHIGGRRVHLSVYDLLCDNFILIAVYTFSWNTLKLDWYKRRRSQEDGWKIFRCIITTSSKFQIRAIRCFAKNTKEALYARND